MPVGFFSFSPIELTFIFYFLFSAFYSFVFHMHHYITKKCKFSYLVFFLYRKKKYKIGRRKIILFTLGLGQNIFLWPLACRLHHKEKTALPCSFPSGFHCKVLLKFYLLCFFSCLKNFLKFSPFLIDRGKDADLFWNSYQRGPSLHISAVKLNKKSYSVL